MSPDLTPAALPSRLASRVHVVDSERQPARSPGPGAVVYWMRTAVRVHDNPALDVAVAAARMLRRPVWIYHALSERYPYASDRHHRFILEGARDVEAECVDRGIGYGFHLERPGHRGPHLRTIGADAALVVTEDTPVEPLASWTRRLARSIDVPVWAVDTSCLVPMRSVPAAAVQRAYRFREATASVRREQLASDWLDEAYEGAPHRPALPFEPVQLATADLDALIATCAIDHAVAPVPHTKGGSKAGYARWGAFVQSRLRTYHRTRNDPMRDGVSRMSAYLHYGHVSPFRIAREASEAGGDGARKYLDELLVWRELAWAFCAAHPEHASIAVLPKWARETLREHEADPRPDLPSWETLARSRTGDALWDAAQDSLRIHGELHNNVRMTWGKALLGWTPDAERALALLEDLNHRYALDGRDPASYGGLLWCLGVFDRPFRPEQRILGSVRGRSTRSHARRLDPQAWGLRTGRPALVRPPRVAVIGAGIAGLACARTLSDHGLSPVLFDKGRRPGGRCATRESRDRPSAVFDHGAQYFTARDPAFRRLVASWAHDGRVAGWPGSYARIEGPRVVGVETPGASASGPGADVPTGSRWVGVPSMASLAEHLASDLNVQVGVRVEAVQVSGSTVTLRADDGRELGEFDVVVVTTPPEQAVPLVSGSPALTAAAARAELEPCWAVLAECDARVDAPADALAMDGRILAWCARDSSKPGRPAGERWVLHATPEWTRTNLDRSRDDAARELWDAFRSRIEGLGGAPPEAAALQGHLWRYARASRGAIEEPATDATALSDPSSGLILAGDGVGGTSRIESAWLSGVAAAARVLGSGRTGPSPIGGAPSDPRHTVEAQRDLFGE
ncbi:MAG: NAD(P)-binding protein [Gemmatimonadetes bacterium]|nr:NAD(P)-binding protein [Gemmatimonadota bacterium]